MVFLNSVIFIRSGINGSKSCFRCFSQSSRLTKTQNSAVAAYYRGGTSRAVMFQEKDLPTDRKLWDNIFLGIMGSPDPNGRQLDGIGGGVSSLSKVCVVGPSKRSDADVDYTFVAIGVKTTEVDYSSNCGNMIAAIGPFAIDSGMIKSGSGKDAVVRIHNTNTGKLIHSSFPIEDYEAQVSGDLVVDGVAGTGAKIELAFLDPA
jgi:2-methylaconitate cis-trans-isomerase PrpF